MSIYKAFLYKITHTPTDYRYYGVTIKRDKTAYERFEEHMAGIGAVAIADLLEAGETRESFTLSILSDFDDYEDALIEETNSIRNDPLAKLNGNGGGGFGTYHLYSCLKYGLCPKLYKQMKYGSFIGESIEDTKIQKEIWEIVNSKYTTSMIDNFDRRSVYSYIDEIADSLFLCEITTFDEIIDIKNIAKYSRYLTFSSAKEIDKFQKYMSKLTDQEIDQFFWTLSEFKRCGRNIQYERLGVKNDAIIPINNSFFNSFFEVKHANLIDWYRSEYGRKLNSPSESVGWVDGRNSYRDRISTGVKTYAEINKIAEASQKTSDVWSTRDIDERKRITENGIVCFTAQIHVCQHCGRGGLSLGNLKRWHNDNCKSKNKENNESIVI